MTDVPRPGFAAELLNNLQAAYHFAYNIFRAKIQDQPAPGPLWVYVYRSEKQYAEFARRNQAADWSSGFYNPAGLIAFHAQGEGSRSTLAILVHETMHALLDRHIVRPGILLPRWLDEGFAEYMELSDIEGGRIIPGRHRRKWDVHRQAGVGVWSPTIAAVEIDQIKKRVREGTAFSLGELVRTDAEHFYGERHELYYAQSYLLVHFLQHGRTSWATEEFPRFVLYVAEGYPCEDAFRWSYGQPPTSFQEQFETYVKKF